MNNDETGGANAGANAGADDAIFGDDSFRMPTRRRLEVGEVVEGQVVSIGQGDVFVDVGAKSEGAIDIKELTDDEGNVGVKLGDTVSVYVVELEPELVLSYGLGRAHLDQQRLQDAADLGLPVEGKVTGVNKGGLDVQIAGVRAFCPVSQIQLGFCEDPSVYVEQTLTFKIQRYEEGGRNIIVSRRALLEEEQEQAAEETRAQLIPGAEFWGEVKRIQPFGAFIDIGGIQGMVHVSEISHQRIDSPAEVLEVGQRVRVQVKKIEPDPKRPGQERIGLSMRALLDDPWETSVRALREGETVQGTVVRIQPFGAFVELMPGVDGLIHVSELADRRIGHPEEVVAVGETVSATVLKVDTAARRISLSLRQVAGSSEAPRESVDLSVGTVYEVVVDNIKPYGLFVNIKGGGRRGRGLIPAEETGTPRGTNLRRMFPEGKELRAMLIHIDGNKLRLSLTAVEDYDERQSYSEYQRGGGGGGGGGRDKRSGGGRDKRGGGGGDAPLNTMAEKLMAALNKGKEK